MEQIEALYGLLERAAAHLAEWSVPDELALARIERMRQEWPEVAALMTPDFMVGAYAVEALVEASKAWSIETQELIVAMVLEPFGDLVDGLAECMANPFVPRLDPGMGCGELRSLLEEHAGWAIGQDYSERGKCAQFWYVSEEKQEPRLGDRHAEPGAELESPLDIARRFNDLYQALDGQSGTLAAFLMAQPEHRFAARRAQNLARFPYSEIRDNLIGEGCLPIDMLRCKLSFFGAAKFDPKSDRWTRIALAQGAPLFDELEQCDDWWLASFES
jgi:hypothetical protein